MLAYLPGDGVAEAAKESLRLDNPEARMWGVMLAVKNQVQVTPEDVTPIADSRELLAHFAAMIEKANRADLLPAKYRTNEAIAISRMVEWLIYPTELGEPPEKVEVARRVEEQLDNRTRREYFVLKFLPKSESGSPPPVWKMGVCGPYRAGTFDPLGGDEVFSEFTPWAPDKEEEEVHRIRAQLHEAWKLEQSRSKRSP
jgi:hypothetical protein